MNGLSQEKQIQRIHLREVQDHAGKHIKPRLGGCFPLAFNDGLIEQFANELLFEEELAPKTVKDILVVLRSILNYTAKRFPDTFPKVDIVYPKESKKKCVF